MCQESVDFLYALSDRLAGCHPDRIGHGAQSLNVRKQFQVFVSQRLREWEHACSSSFDTLVQLLGHGALCWRAVFGEAQAQ